MSWKSTRALLGRFTHLSLRQKAAAALGVVSILLIIDRAFGPGPISGALLVLFPFAVLLRLASLAGSDLLFGAWRPQDPEHSEPSADDGDD